MPSGVEIIPASCRLGLRTVALSKLVLGDCHLLDLLDRNQRLQSQVSIHKHTHTDTQVFQIATGIEGERTCPLPCVERGATTARRGSCTSDQTFLKALLLVLLACSPNERNNWSSRQCLAGGRAAHLRGAFETLHGSTIGCMWLRLRDDDDDVDDHCHGNVNGEEGAIEIPNTYTLDLCEHIRPLCCYTLTTEGEEHKKVYRAGVPH